MILDERLEMLDATALNTGAAGTYLVGDVIDTSIVNKDLGHGEDLWAVIRITTAVTSGGAATVQFQLASDAQAAIATDGSATIHAQTAAIPKATLIAGYTALAIRLPAGTYERYLGILQITGTAALTAGAADAYLTKDYASWSAYPDASN